MTDYAIFSGPALREFAPGGTDEERLAHVLSLGPLHAGVTLGAEGYTWRERDDRGHVPAFSVSVTDTTGAGDAFHGAFALMLAEGADIRTAVRFSAAAAALKCANSARAGILGAPSRAEVEAFLAKN